MHSWMGILGCIEYGIKLEIPMSIQLCIAAHKLMGSWGIAVAEQKDFLSYLN